MADTGKQIKDAGVASKHPDWEQFSEEWTLMRDATRGETAIKDKGTDYLPMPGGFTAQRDKGVEMYNAYKSRAQFPDIVDPTINGMAGLIHKIEAQVELPSQMEPLFERATKDGMPLESFHSMITHELLETGRYGILVDASEDGSEVPWLAGYATESIINWSTAKDFYVLDESGPRREGFEWKHVDKWRELTIDENSNYVQKVYSTSRQEPDDTITPQAKGGRPMDVVPFVTVNPFNLGVAPSTPPLIGVARSAKAIYQLSADYRHQLFNTGQETLFLFNMEAPEVVGSGVIVNTDPISKDAHPPSAEYVGPDGIGIDSHRTAIVDERNNAAAAGARLFNTQGSDSVQESGEARKVRFASETASLMTISIASAAALEKALRFAARMMGLNEDDVTVKPNLTFFDTSITAQDAVNLVKLWQEGSISYQTLYENLQKGEIASAERDHEEELKLIDKEDAEMNQLQNSPGATGMLPRNQNNPNNPNDPGNVNNPGNLENVE